MDKTIQITVRNKIAVKTCETVYICGNSDFSVHFTFDEEWAAHTLKTARFILNDGTFVDQPFTGVTCPVPILKNTYSFNVGVYAGNLSTTTPAYCPAKKSILCPDGTPKDPEPDVYNEIIDLINTGKVKGEKGDKGDKGDPGKDAPQDSIRYTSQTLTEAQRKQARTNIGAQPEGNYALKTEIPSVPVQSVNGKTGAVQLTAADVGALPKDTPIPEAYTLPTASPETKGGAKIGNGLQMDGEVLEVVPEGKYKLIEKIYVGCEIVKEKPDDWATNWHPYFFANATSILQPIDHLSKAPAWQNNYYYRKTGAGGISALTRTQEPDGTSYDLAACKILIKAATEQKAGHYRFAAYDTSNNQLLTCTCKCLQPDQNSRNYYSSAAFVIQRTFGMMYDVYLLSGQQGSYPEIIKPANLYGENIKADKNISKLEMSLLTVEEIVERSTIEIWGVRA